MSFVLGVLLSIGALLGAVLIWTRLAKDPLGSSLRERRRGTGFHGQLTEWLYWDAPLTAPRLDEADRPTKRIDQVGDRALDAVLSRLSAERQISRDAAHDHLLRNVKSPAPRFFLQGKVKRAIRAHWRTRYRGPDPLFGLWFYLVVTIRHGRRHLYLEALAGILKELQRT